MATVQRNGERHEVDDVQFWELVRSGGLLPTDLILCTDGHWRHPFEVDVVRDFVPGPGASGNRTGLTKLLVLIAAAGGLAWLVFKASEPSRSPRSVRRNTEPLPDWLKDEIRERDDYTCHYCGVRVRVGHIDHKNPRVLGGSNRRNNLVLACARCNLVKSDMTAQQFERLLGSQ